MNDIIHWGQMQFVMARNGFVFGSADQSD